jgi:CheY-like chemotaxis protein
MSFNASSLSDAAFDSLAMANSAPLDRKRLRRGNDCALSANSAGRGLRVTMLGNPYGPTFSSSWQSNRSWNWAMPTKILIVDDNPAIRRLIRCSIESNTDWMVCGEAENGKVAIAMVDKLKPDVVILDLSMPVMNGLDAAREISKLVPSTPMIMFTMHEFEAIREQAHQAGVQLVFSKEHGFGDDALEAIRKIISARAA